jgi:hypothetical protein
LRQLAAARHVGKIVVGSSHGGGSRSQGSTGRWVISGGMGALGTLAAQWLSCAGAAHIALLGRSGVADVVTPLVASALQPLSMVATATAGGGWAGAVSFVKCDAASASDAANVLDTAVVGRLCPPAAGLLHAGGVLKDATLQNQQLSGKLCQWR